MVTKTNQQNHWIDCNRFVESHNIDWDETQIPNAVLQNAGFKDEDTYSPSFNRGSINLKGGGMVIYQYYPGKTNELLQYFNDSACTFNTALQFYDPTSLSSQDKYKKNEAKKNDTETLPLGPKDVLLLSAGAHGFDLRRQSLHTFQTAFECLQKRHNKRKHPLSFGRREDKGIMQWPNLMYQQSTVTHFWTRDGSFSAKKIEGKNWNTCKPFNDYTNMISQDKLYLGEDGNLVKIIGHQIPSKSLGNLHVWHSDCLHWIQPGIPDVYAAEIADYVYELQKN